MNASFACVLIGRGQQLVACADLLLSRSHQVVHVISDCVLVAEWAQRHGVNRTSPGEDFEAALSRETFDYFFSIVNHAITPTTVLEMARLGAINYHDSLLPAHSGFHATTWSILDGAVQHGITWHRMTQTVDAGPYLLQRSFPISEHDTAFTVAARAAELAIRTFPELVEQLENNSATETPSQPARDFRSKSERPGLVVLDWTRPIKELLRICRAFDFGNEDNWLTCTKLQTPSGDFLCIGSVTLTAGSEGPPGTVIRATEDGISIQGSDGALHCEHLTTLEGAPVGETEFPRYGFVIGATLPKLTQANVDAADNLDRAATKSERFWVSRLQRLCIPKFTELKLQAPLGQTASIDIPLTEPLLTLASDALQTMLTAGLAIYSARVNDQTTLVNLPVCLTPLTDDLLKLYSPIVPMSFDIDLNAAWQTVIEQAGQELTMIRSRGAYARDVWTRYSSLRNKPISDRQMPIAIDLDGNDTELPKGVRLLLRLGSDGGRIQALFDLNAIHALQVERIVGRLIHLIQAALETPKVPVGNLSIVPNAEREILLEAFQDTHCDSVNVACIHDLFAKQVDQTPDKTALVFRDDSLSYRELDERSNFLAQHLQELGVGPDKLVAIAIERSLEMVIGLLAILKAGGAYVPLDPAYPAERLTMMLEDSGASWLLTQDHLREQLPPHSASIVIVDDPTLTGAAQSQPRTSTDTSNLAYVIFTSGSTGRPKGVMIEHRNVANFFAGMDERVGPNPGIWLAVTSISFDISVLEIFWTLCRGFETVVQEEGDTASMRNSQSEAIASTRPMGFGLFYFAADSSNSTTANAYKLLLEGARFADNHDFVAVWTPERHFHAFGGLYPNPAVTSAAIASITSKVELRAGSVVIPLHDPIRVAEEWAVVDNISEGRVGLSFASGWHINDFVLKPENYERRREVMQESIDTVLRLWAGEEITVKNGRGEKVEVSVLPKPIRPRPPMWVASAGNIETFRFAGRSGYNVLTNMLGQDIPDLASKFAAYREARKEAGHEGEGIITVMLHTFVTDDDEQAKQLARGPFGNYLKTSYDLVKVAPWMFPAFKQPSASTSSDDGNTSAFDPERFDDDDMAALLDHAFDRYFDTAGLFGTPQRALKMVEQLKDIGATEVACLVDFGIDSDTVLENLKYLDQLRRLANPTISAQPKATPVSIREQFERREITHFQCTPSLARILIADGTLASMKSLSTFLIGGEALATDLAKSITSELSEVVLVNMYGPTETTVWSTTETIDKAISNSISIGTPIANTQIRILDSQLQLLPLGTPGELCIGGDGVARGYLDQPELTAKRFVADPVMPSHRIYRTGDLARFADNGKLEYLGRLDQQVKVNGYRIELGEIEAILQRHPAVKQAVVAVKGDQEQPHLVGYIVAASNNSGEGVSRDPHTTDWQHRWDKAYATRSGADHSPARFNTSGWFSSYDGEPIATAAMREWLDQTIASIKHLDPQRVLEIGCGTGMLLYACLEHVEHYTAVDVSAVALESIQNELTATERSKVTLLNCAAEQFDAVPDGSCDVVIINSVAQYFPNTDYLIRVLKQASRVLQKGGSLFLGDIRCQEVASLFYTRVELEKAPRQTAVAELVSRICRRASLETELLLTKEFFATITDHVPELHFVSMQNKQGVHASEMRDFRFDIVLGTGTPAPQLDVNSATIIEHPDCIAIVTEALDSRPSMLLLTGVPDARLDRVKSASEIIAGGDNSATATSLSALLTQAADGIDPDTLRSLHADYDAEVRFGALPGTFDALLRRKGQAPTRVWMPGRDVTAATSNTPITRIDADNLTLELARHVQDFLPAYMAPKSFMVIDSLPLTPNGKIDRKALPAPRKSTKVSNGAYTAPNNDLEHTIAGIWQDLLGLERVGRKDNIFDLGASSLLTVQANSKLQDVLKQKIPLVAMFRYPTIESLSAHLGAPNTDAESVNKERQDRLSAAATRRRQARAKQSRKRHS